MSEIKELFKDKGYCLKELSNARKLFGSTTTTEVQYTMMEASLALMYLYCPKEIQILVQATLTEAEQRKVYFNFSGDADN